MAAISGLYAVTPETGDSAVEQDRLFANVALVLEGGARVLQYRCKNPDATFGSRRPGASRCFAGNKA